MNILDEINNNLSSFLEQLLHMASNHNQKQLELYLEMQEDLRRFNVSYHSIFNEKENQFRRINNHYTVHFLDFDEHHIPFDNSNDCKSIFKIY